MSFILDALRKSEHERQRRAGPAIADMAVAPRRSNAIPVLIGVGALLAINLAAIAYFALRDDPPVAPAGSATGTAPAALLPGAPAVPANAAITRPPSSPAPAVEAPRVVRSLAAEADSFAPAPVPDAAPPPAPDPLLLPPPSAPPPALAPQLRPAAGDYIPRLDTLPPQATAGLPPLNLELHIFANDAGKRAVFINGRRYREGDTLPEGVEVVAITTDGAVLRHRGQRFLLPRQ